MSRPSVNRRRRATPAAAAALLAILLAVQPAAGADRAKLELAVDSPKAGSVIGDVGGMAFVSGKALALFGDYQTFDIVFVIDRSDSTATPSGYDVDGDGEIGQRGGNAYTRAIAKLIPILPNSDLGDSILAAEVAALEKLLTQLDPRTTRVGLVAFHGDRDPLTPDAYTEVPLTSDFKKVKRGLSAVLRAGPHGMTNMMTAVQLGTIELTGSQSAYSERRPGAKRVMLFLTDGMPTLPFDSRLDNARSAVKHARKASEFDIRIDTYAIGPDALAEPIVVVEMARVTNGVFTPILDPSDLRAVFEEVNFAEIEELKVHNATTKAEAEYTIQNADGSFSALVPMREGWNTINVYARASDGAQKRRQVKVRFLPGADVQALSPRLLAQRNRLMENRLLDLQRRRLEIETERDEQVRSDLNDRINAEREKASKKVDDMRRELELEVLDD